MPHRPITSRCRRLRVNRKVFDFVGRFRQVVRNLEHFLARVCCFLSLGGNDALHETSPHLQLWGDLIPNRGMFSVEPCTSERLPNGLSSEEPVIEPGQVRRYALSVLLDDTSPCVVAEPWRRNWPANEHLTYFGPTARSSTYNPTSIVPARKPAVQ